jgi:hypothetical protein
LRIHWSERLDLFWQIMMKNWWHEARLLASLRLRTNAGCRRISKLVNNSYIIAFE